MENKEKITTQLGSKRSCICSTFHISLENSITEICRKMNFQYTCHCRQKPKYHPHSLELTEVLGIVDFCELKK